MLEMREHEVSPLGLIDVGATAFIWFAAQLFSLVPVLMFMGLEISELNNIAALSAEQQLELQGWTMVCQLLATFFAIIWFLIRHRRVEWLGTTQGFARDVLIGLAGSLMLIPVVMLIQLVATQLIPYSHPTLDSLSDNFTMRTAIWAWISAVGIAPLTEEFFFRGVLQGWLQRAMDHNESAEKWLIGGPLETSPDPPQIPAVLASYQNWAPIVITSMIFAGVHFGQGPAPIPLFFLSLGLGYLFRKTGSFVPCVIVHVVLNSLSMIILTLGLVYPELAPADPEPVPAYLLK